MKRVWSPFSASEPWLKDNTVSDRDIKDSIEIVHRAIKIEKIRTTP